MKKYKPHKPPRISHKPSSLINQGSSGEELDLHNTIKLLLPDTPTFKGNRTILHGREIDIWIPTWKIGIEYDGLWFHSAATKSINYHLWKTIEAEKIGVRLIHIWSDIWTSKRSQTVDYLSKVFRKFTLIKEDISLEEIDKSKGDAFLNNTHILGTDLRANKYIGLFYKTSLITVFSFEVEDNNWTLLRRGELRTLRIERDISRTLDFIQEKYGDTVKFKAEIDRSLFNGMDLKKEGFIITGCSAPEAVWTKDFKSRRLQENLSEEQLEKAGFHKFYNCGKLFLEK